MPDHVRVVLLRRLIDRKNYSLIFFTKYGCEQRAAPALRPRALYIASLAGTAPQNWLGGVSTSLLTRAG